MIFSSFEFTLVFLPIVFLGYTLLLRGGHTTASKSLLIVASFFFFAYGSGDFFPLFVASVFLNYGVGRALASVRQERGEMAARAVLAIGVLANVSLLGYYKYTNFAIANINVFLDTPLPYQDILLPVGISFFTFQLIAYLFDSYRGETRGISLMNYLLFITFFPQLIVGPIIHHDDVVGQFDALEPGGHNSAGVALGLFLFAIGCSKKLVLADPLSGWAQRAFDSTASLSMLDAWGASLSYTLSYYFDLSGYADMAIGLGLLFGITLPINFDSPYKARNFADYWNRWHITLSRFLGDYVFRSVFRKGAGSTNFYWAVFVTFLVSGLWHGAGWTFVVWGVVNGLFVIASHMMRRNGLALPGPLAWAVTFLGVIGVRVLFVSRTFQDAANVYTSAFAVSSFSLTDNVFLGIRQPLYLAAGLAIVLLFPNSNQLRERYQPNVQYALLTASLLLVSFLNMSNAKGFLYFQF